jgi:anti-sigma factor RsiW
MSGCTRARELFGSYWDDETSKAERDWLDAHFGACAACRSEYDALARTLSTVGALPRAEAAPELAERALAEARRRAPARDRLSAPSSPRWVPAAAVATLLLVAGGALAPLVLRPVGPLVARNAPRVSEPRLVATATPTNHGPARSSTHVGSADGAGASVSDSLFDHSEDVDFVLDPVTLRRGRAHTSAHMPMGIKGEQAVISF